MNSFPHVDPIPLPAPVWLFKILHVLTLALHFITVEVLLGGLVMALILNLVGRAKDPASVIRYNASASMARRLPVIMTYVINLGVPPLLFAQVLYGRSIYTSSVLIGTWWIAVIFLLIGCYWHLYRFAAKIETVSTAWPKALVALILALIISRIYSTNMALMIHPEMWRKLYADSALGTHLINVPTLLPRWLFMLTGGLAAGGLWMVWLSSRPAIDGEVRHFLGSAGGKFALVMLALQVFMAAQVFKAQPQVVKDGLASNIYYHSAVQVWLGGMFLLICLAAWAGFGKPKSAAPAWLVLVVGLVTMLGMATVRDGIRDLTLMANGYDVWDRAVAANWQVVVIFLLLFVAGLGVVGWLASVVLRAKPRVEKVIG